MSRRMWTILVAVAVPVLIMFVLVGGAVLAVSLHDGTYRSLALKQTVDSINGTQTLDETRVQEIFTRVVEQTPIPTSGITGDPEFPSVIDDHAWGTLVRGRAYCDSQSMALVQLLYQAGFEAQLLFLYNDDGISPHSVATVRLHDEWLVLDPLYGAIPVAAGGNWVSVEQMKAIALANPDAGYRTSQARQSQGYGDAFVPAAWFIESKAFWDSEINAPSGVRSGIEFLVGSSASLLWPLVSTVRPLLVSEPMYLPNPPQPGDTHYERARTLELVGDQGGALEQYEIALEVGTQWDSRIQVYRQKRVIDHMSVLVPLETKKDGLVTPSREPS